MKGLMKLAVILFVVLLFCLPMYAGDTDKPHKCPFAGTKEKAPAEHAHKCEHSAQHCLDNLSANLRGRGVIGLDGDWDKELGGYRVTAYVEGTTARKAGVKLGDLLVKVNGIPLKDEATYAEDAMNRMPGEKGTITVLRDDVEHEMDITFMSMTDQMIAEEIGRHMLDSHLN